jgi:Flp pilus assembly protein TadD
MLVGRPALARQIWLKAKDPPSEAVRVSRLADTFWVEQDYEEAVRLYREARRHDPRRAEPSQALAWLYAERGQAEAALGACRDALSLPLADPQRDEIQSLQDLLRAHAPHAE